MWNLNCGCSDISTEHIEFNIINNPINSMTIDFELPKGTDNIDCLREKIIQDFYKIVDNLECGIQLDLEEILENISSIDIKLSRNFGVAKKIYSNNDGTDEDDYLRKNNQLSEFEKSNEKYRAIKNLGLDGINHVIISRLEYDNLNEYLQNTLYFVQDYE